MLSFLQDDVKDAINKMKKDKAPSMDWITRELLHGMMECGDWCKMQEYQNNWSNQLQGKYRKSSSAIKVEKKITEYFHTKLE